jgi:oligopeptide transport system substrate-binding protein
MKRQVFSTKTFAWWSARRVSLVLLLITVMLILAACNPLASDDDASSIDATPSPEAQIPDQPEADEPTPVAQIEEDEAGWTILTGPERSEAPAERNDDQVLRIAGSSEVPTTIDPALVRDTSAAFLARQVFRGLVKLDESLEPVPDLAYQIEISPDGQVYRFHLHDGITFHDGSAITAGAIKASLERAGDPALTDGDGEALPARNYLDDIQGARERMSGERDDIPGIEVIDDRTLEISLDRGVVDLLERLANPSLLVVDVSQAEIGGTWWQQPNGSGPFQLDSWDADRLITLEAHDGYVTPPRLARVEMRVGAESVGQMQLYETGQIDYVGVPLSVLDRIQYDGSPIPGELRQNSMNSTSFVMFNTEIAPFDQPELRQAIMKAFPRDQVTSVMFDGRVETANSVLPPGMWDTSSSEFPFGHDPEAAREIVAAADVDVVTIYSSGGGVPIALKHFVEEELGLEVEVVQLRWSDYLEDMDNRQLGMFVLSWVADGPDPVSFIRALFHSGSPDNYARMSDPEVDQLLDDAAIEQDAEARMDLLDQAHARILDAAVVMPLYHTVDYTLVAEHVNGLQTTPMGILGLETVWIDD